MEGNNLHRFLESCQAQYRQLHHESKPLHVVLGNESADLDSVVSSLLYAYFLTKSEQYAEHTVLPVVNTQSSNIDLRTEVIAVMKRYGIPENCLVYKDNIDLLGIREKRLLSITLVDHNVLSLGQEHLKENVTEVIDHHKDESIFTGNDIMKKIYPVGSCCTLISEIIINQNPELLKTFPVPDLLLCAILGDTQNLSSEAGRGSEYDIEVCEELQEYVATSGDELYEFVRTAKYDISGLSSVDILRKDFKFVPVPTSSIRGGISSITMESDRFFARDDAIRTIMTYCTVQKLDFMLLMFIWTTRSVTKRELVIFSVSDTIRSAMASHLTQDIQLDMTPSETLNDLEGNCSKYFLSFEQRNIKVSRKVIMPVLVGFLETSSLSTSQDLSFFTSDDSIMPRDFTDLNNQVPEEIKGQPAVTSFNGESDDVFALGNSTPRVDTRVKNGTPTGAPVVFKDEENIRKIQKEIESFENEKNNVSFTSWEQSATSYIRTKSEIEFDRILYGSTSSEMTNTGESERGSVTVDRSDSFIRKLVNEAYAADEAELKQSFEGEWDQEAGIKRNSVSGGGDAKALIYIKDLSFDFEESPDVHGSDVFAPVFLAVTEEEEDDEEDEVPSPTAKGGKSDKLGLKNMRKKAQSIENLCVVLGSSDTDIPSLRSRSKSDLPFKYRRKGGGKRHGKKVTKQRSYDDNFNTEFDRDDSGAWSPADRLGRKFHSQENILDDSPSAEKRPMVRFQDDQFFRVSSDFSDSNLYRGGKLEIQEDDGQPYAPAQRLKTHNTASIRDAHKSVERLYFDEEEQRPLPDGSSDEAHESVVTYTVPESPHVRGLWNRYIAVNVGIQQRIIDLELIEPYMKVISHGGCCYNGDRRQTVMVFTACYLPKKSLRKYDIIMEQLFYYVIHTLDLLVEDDYIIVYFNSGIDSSGLPKRSWLRECYYMIDRRLKKSLSALYFVHPNFWLRAMIKLYRPFISGKFYKKIKLMSSLSELESNISTEYIFIPEEVKNSDPDFLHWSRRQKQYSDVH